MGRYKVQRDYTSNLGSFEKGSTVDVEDPLAEHLNRDSPGLLKPAKGKKKTDTDDQPKANDGNVDEVIARVGDDPEAAAEALEAEQAEKNPRTTLVQALEAIVNGDDGESDDEAG